MLDEGKTHSQPIVAIDAAGRREWLARPEVRRVFVSIAYYKLGLRRDEIDELVQDFYRDKLFALAKAYDPSRGDLALARTAFWRYGLNWIRAKKTERQGVLLSFDDPDQSDALMRQTSTQPFLDHLEPVEQVEVMQRARERLSSSHRRYIQLAHYEDRSTEQIAGELGVSVGAAKVGLHRARAKLRELILDEGFALGVDDILDWPGVATLLIRGFEAQDTPAGKLCRLLSPDLLEIVRQCSRLAARRRVVEDLNRVFRTSDLRSVEFGSRDTAIALLSVGQSPRGQIQRNRSVFELLFEPYVLKSTTTTQAI